LSFVPAVEVALDGEAVDRHVALGAPAGPVSGRLRRATTTVRSESAVPPSAAMTTLVPMSRPAASEKLIAMSLPADADAAEPPECFDLDQIVEAKRQDDAARGCRSYRR
jgi:hypothetical protein